MPKINKTIFFWKKIAPKYFLKIEAIFVTSATEIAILGFEVLDLWNIDVICNFEIINSCTFIIYSL